jgi:NDP-sugar pyrophosphorylase family protein
LSPATKDQREATMVVLHREDRSQSGAVDLDGDGRVVTFSSRPTTVGAGLINAGIYMVHRRVLDAIPRGRRVSLEAEVLPELAQGGTLFGWLANGAFIDIGTPETYRAAQRFFANR